MRIPLTALSMLVAGGTALAADLSETVSVGGHKAEIATPADGHFRILLDGKQIYAGESDITYFRPPVSGGGHSYLIIEKGTGGTACPALYVAIDVSGSQPVISKELGNCSDNPKVSVVDGVLQMAFPKSGRTKAAIENFDGSKASGSSGQATVADADRKASVEQFLRHLYDGYADGATVRPPNANAASGAAVFDPELLGLLRRAGQAAQSGSRRVLVADPICNCQDWGNLSVIHVNPTMDGPDKATAVLSFNNFGKRNVMDYQVVSIDGQWRVHDIGTTGMPSLRKSLIDGLAKR